MSEDIRSRSIGLVLTMSFSNSRPITQKEASLSVVISDLNIRGRTQSQGGGRTPWHPLATCMSKHNTLSLSLCKYTLCGLLSIAIRTVAPWRPIFEAELVTLSQGGSTSVARRPY